LPATNAQRRRRNWILIAAVLLLMLMGALSGTRQRLPTPYFDLPAPMVIAHQGGNLLHPGNTLLAFDHAVSIGVDVLEMDVHLSSDGHVVVIHDDTVDRTTNGVGAVVSKSLAELQGLDAGYHWPFSGAATLYRDQGVFIPSFEQVLKRYPTERLLVELKTPAAPLAAATCTLLRKHQRETMVLIASFHHAALLEFRRLCPSVATGASAEEISSFVRLWRFGLTQFFNSPALVLQVPKKREDKQLLNAQWVAAARQQNLFVDYWTLNSPEDMRAAIKVGAQGIITDRPDLLMDELGRR
jgi:glycerophosphoryl diester phosphodiesterase